MKNKTLKKAALLLSLSAAILIILSVSYFRSFDYYELTSLDLRFLLRPAQIVTDKIAIIEIGEDSIKKLGRFPFDRSYHAILIKALSEFGARSVIFDVFFSEPQSSDAEMEEALKKSGNVYLPYVLEMDHGKAGGMPSAKGYLARCLGRFEEAAKGTGHIDIVPDSDGKFRKVPLLIEHDGKLRPYLAFKAACDYLNIPQEGLAVVPGESIIIPGGKVVPLDNRSAMLINYSGKWANTYKHYSYIDILQSYSAYISGTKPIIDPAELKDKICIIGLTAAGTGDIHPSPFEALYPGVGIQAEVFNSILNGKFISRVSRGVNLAVLFFLCLIMSVMTFKTKPLKGFLTLLSITALFLLVSILLFDIFGIWVDMVYPIFAISVLYILLTLYRYISEWKRRVTLENELDIAKKIQESFLPKKMPKVEGLDIAAAMFTARQVGGDLYDFVDPESGKLGVMIGDVSGKGVPASLFMAMVVGAFRSFAKLGVGPETVLSKLNTKLVDESASNLFVTVFYSIFDLERKTLIFSNGGHLPVIRLAKDGKTDILDVDEGAPLGLMEGNYSAKEVRYQKGDVFVFYTDGVTEAMNSRSEMYGRDRLVSVVKKNSSFTAEKILEAIHHDIRKFEPKPTQHDDITVIVISVRV